MVLDPSPPPLPLTSLATLSFHLASLHVKTPFFSHEYASFHTHPFLSTYKHPFSPVSFDIFSRPEVPTHQQSVYFHLPIHFDFTQSRVFAHQNASFHVNTPLFRASFYTFMCLSHNTSMFHTHTSLFTFSIHIGLFSHFVSSVFLHINAPFSQYIHVFPYTYVSFHIFPHLFTIFHIFSHPSATSGSKTSTERHFS